MRQTVLAITVEDNLINASCDLAFKAIAQTLCLFVALVHLALREFRRVLQPERGRVAIYTTAPELKGTPAAPYPLATRGHFYEDEELAEFPRAAGFREGYVLRPGPGAQLLVARP